MGIINIQLLPILLKETGRIRCVSLNIFNKLLKLLGSVNVMVYQISVLVSCFIYII